MSLPSTSGQSALYPDHCGVPITATSEDAVALLDAALGAFVSHHADLAARLDAALAADPALLRAHVLRGATIRLSGRIDDVPLARESLAAAKASLAERGGTPGERALVSALESWCARDADRTVATFESLLDAEPTDLFALKAVHAMYLMLGRPDAMRASLAKRVPAWRGSGLRHEGAVLGCYSFALEEAGALDEAERVGIAACDQETNAWSVHAVAHVFHTQGRPDVGARWLVDRKGCLPGVGAVAYHVHWHGAVFSIALGRSDEALAVYDELLESRLEPDYRDFVNASTLLLRLELAGLDVGARWTPLADVAERRGRDHGLAFSDAHFALALARDGREQKLRGHVAELEAVAAEAPGVDGKTLREVGVPVGHAIAALGSDPARTASELRRLAPELQRLGGSNAQREVFTVLTAWAERMAAEGGPKGRTAAPRSAGLS